MADRAPRPESAPRSTGGVGATTGSLGEESKPVGNCKIQRRRVLDDALMRVTALAGRAGPARAHSLRARLMFDGVPGESWKDQPR